MRRCERGTSLVEALVAAGVAAMGILAAFLVLDTSLRQTGRSKEVEVARLAVARAAENLATVRFRGLTATDNQEWLFRGGYEIARNDNDTAFLLPDLRTAATFSENGVGGCVGAEFPVPPLRPFPGRTHAGRVVFYVNEATQPAAVPTTAFPFEPTLGFSRLDCDGDGLFTTTNLRVRHDQSAAPCRLVPAKITVEWLNDRGMAERYTEYILLGYQGYR